jgi:hypothetical protein
MIIHPTDKSGPIPENETNIESIQTSVGGRIFSTGSSQLEKITDEIDRSVTETFQALSANTQQDLDENQISNSLPENVQTVAAAVEEAVDDLFSSEVSNEGLDDIAQGIDTETQAEVTESITKEKISQRNNYTESVMQRILLLLKEDKDIGCRNPDALKQLVEQITNTLATEEGEKVNFEQTVEIVEKILREAKNNNILYEIGPNGEELPLSEGKFNKLSQKLTEHLIEHFRSQGLYQESRNEDHIEDQKTGQTSVLPAQGQKTSDNSPVREKPTVIFVVVLDGKILDAKMEKLALRRLADFARMQEARERRKNDEANQKHFEIEYSELQKRIKQTEVLEESIKKDTLQTGMLSHDILMNFSHRPNVLLKAKPSRS